MERREQKNAGFVGDTFTSVMWGARSFPNQRKKGTETGIQDLDPEEKIKWAGGNWGKTSPRPLENGWAQGGGFSPTQDRDQIPTGHCAYV